MLAADSDSVAGNGLHRHITRAISRHAEEVFFTVKDVTVCDLIQQGLCDSS